MGLFDRFRRTGRPGVTRGATSHDTSHLEAWAGSHRGVEAFVEPRTTVTETTVVLVAHDGEWTRRRIGDEQAAFRLGRKLGIPVYEVSKVGYPRRMREYTARLRTQTRRQAAD
ncbi:oxidoreductase [Kutzneria sp. NPDC052558]|uniref:oxidoreductase n=1 Tax=Kutzneria sp. NPDC052558 TaxID=3364121 RepID=UPI0037C9D934